MAGKVVDSAIGVLPTPTNPPVENKDTNPVVLDTAAAAAAAVTPTLTSISTANATPPGATNHTPLTKAELKSLSENTAELTPQQAQMVMRTVKIEHYKKLEEELKADQEAKTGMTNMATTLPQPTQTREHPETETNTTHTGTPAPTATPSTPAATRIFTREDLDVETKATNARTVKLLENMGATLTNNPLIYMDDDDDDDDGDNGDNGTVVGDLGSSNTTNSTPLIISSETTLSNNFYVPLSNDNPDIPNSTPSVKSLIGRAEKESSQNGLFWVLGKIWDFITWPFKAAYNGISSLGSTHNVSDITTSVKTDPAMNSSSSGPLITSFSTEDGSASGISSNSPVKETKKRTLLENCEKRTTAFVKSAEFIPAFDEMQRIFDHNKDKGDKAAEEFKQLRDKLTTSIPFAQNKFNAVELYLSYSLEELVRRDATGAKRKLICEAYYEYAKIRKEIFAKVGEMADNRARNKEHEYKNTYDNFIEDLDDLQKNLEPQNYHLRFMLNQLINANAIAMKLDTEASHDDHLYRNAWSRMENCMTFGYNDDEVIKLEKVLRKSEGCLIPTDESDLIPTDESERRLLVRAYKIFFRERVILQDKVTDADITEISALQYLNLNFKAKALKAVYENSSSDDLKDLLMTNGLALKQYERLEAILEDEDEDEKFFNFEGNLTRVFGGYQPTNHIDRMLLLKAYDIYSKNKAKPKAKKGFNVKATNKQKTEDTPIKIELRKQATRMNNGYDDENGDRDVFSTAYQPTGQNNPTLTTRSSSPSGYDSETDNDGPAENVFRPSSQTRTKLPKQPVVDIDGNGEEEPLKKPNRREKNRTNETNTTPTQTYSTPTYTYTTGSDVYRQPAATSTASTTTTTTPTNGKNRRKLMKQPLSQTEDGKKANSGTGATTRDY